VLPTPPSTARDDARRTKIRVVHYPWHPLHGREVIVQAYRAHDIVLCVPVGVEATKGNTVVMPDWLLDEVACTTMTLVAEPFVAVEVLEELQRLLIETRAMDAPCALAETRAHERPSSSPSRPDEPDASAPVRSSVDESSQPMARGARRSCRADADGTRSSASQRGSKGVAR
jgi:hypothetical protein